MLHIYMYICMCSQTIHVPVQVCVVTQLCSRSLLLPSCCIYVHPVLCGTFQKALMILPPKRFWDPFYHVLSACLLVSSGPWTSVDGSSCSADGFYRSSGLIVDPFPPCHLLQPVLSQTLYLNHSTQVSPSWQSLSSLLYIIYSFIYITYRYISALAGQRVCLLCSILQVVFCGVL